MQYFKIKYISNEQKLINNIIEFENKEIEQDNNNNLLNLIVRQIDDIFLPLEFMEVSKKYRDEFLNIEEHSWL